MKSESWERVSITTTMQYVLWWWSIGPMVRYPPTLRAMNINYLIMDDATAPHDKTGVSFHEFLFIHFVCEKENKMEFLWCWPNGCFDSFARFSADDTRRYNRMCGMHYAYTLSFIICRGHTDSSIASFCAGRVFLNSIKPESGQRTKRRILFFCLFVLYVSKEYKFTIRVPGNRSYLAFGIKTKRTREIAENLWMLKEGCHIDSSVHIKTNFNTKKILFQFYDTQKPLSDIRIVSFLFITGRLYCLLFYVHHSFQ